MTQRDDDSRREFLLWLRDWLMLMVRWIEERYMLPDSGREGSD